MAEKVGRKKLEEFTRTTGQALSDEQKKTLRDMFNKIDADGNRRLSGPEIKRAAKELNLLLAKYEIENLMKEADNNGDGYINYGEFENLLGYQMLISEYRNKQFREAFNNFDKDGNGYITRDELKSVLQENVGFIPECEIDEMFAEADTKHDNKISFEEFCEISFE